MEFKFKIKVGQTEIEITETASSQREFFEKTCFFSGLPTKAPNGSEDLKIVYRKTKGGDEFYSIVSESEKMEYKFGIHKNSPANTLFPKGWEPLYVKPDEDGQDSASEVPVKDLKGKPAFASGKPLTQPSKNQEAPAENTQEEQAAQENIPTPSIAVSKLANIPKPSGAPAAAVPPAKPTGNTSPAVNSVLSKYLKK